MGANSRHNSTKQESRAYFRAFGKRIAQLRKEQGMTQAELARAIGVAQQTVFAYELGDRRVSVFMLDKLTTLFEISAEQLMGMTQRPTAHKRRSRQWMHHAERMRGLSKTAQRFLVRIIDVLEQGEKERRQ